MPVRPAPYVWSLPSYDPADVERHLREIAAPFGMDLTARASDEGVGFVLSASPEALERAAETFDSDRETIDPPPDGGAYRLLVTLLAPGDDEPPRFAISAEEPDNWAAWPVVGPLGDALAERLSATEITGDDPGWLQRELDTAEPPAPDRLPFLAVRGMAVFPGRSRVLTFGRPASVEAVERLVAGGHTRIVVLVQSDPSQEDLPRSLDEILPVGVHARVLSVMHEFNNVVVLLKAIGRVVVRSFDGETAGVEAARETAAPDLDVSRLRDFAARDVLVRDVVGSAVAARVAEWSPGFLADALAQADGNAVLCARALVELDVARRVQLVAAACL